MSREYVITLATRASGETIDRAAGPDAIVCRSPDDLAFDVPLDMILVFECDGAPVPGP